MNADAIPILTDPEARKLVREHCDRVGITIDVLEELLHAESRVLGMGRRHGLFQELEDILANADDQ